MTPNQARRRFARARVARLATVRPGGGPHVVPVVFAVEHERLVFVVDDKPKRTRELARLANIAAEPRVSVLVDHYSESWEQLWWVRADGLARVTREPEELHDAIEVLARKYVPYRSSPPQGPAVLVEIDRWSHWSAD